MEFLTRDVHQCDADGELSDVLWEGRPSLLPYLLINARLSVGLMALAIMVCFMRGSAIAWIAGGGICIGQFVGGMLRWMSMQYTLTSDKAVVTRGSRRFWLGMNELMPTDFRMICSPIEFAFDCRTIVYGVKPMTSALKGPWRNKAVFWCVKGYHKPAQIIRRAYKRNSEQ